MADFWSKTACAENQLPLIKPPLPPGRRQTDPDIQFYGSFIHQIISEKAGQKSRAQEGCCEEDPGPKEAGQTKIQTGQSRREKACRRSVEKSESICSPFA